ncbi:hypothetical protein O988_01893 [Pseudogymnoascus sp. VKM F-3808]|nr:hypothetical protein O988_01893 [Pseudogymnoascus sp. VKM F-3808]
MTAGGENNGLAPSTFPRFSHLAAELRLQIWQHALYSARSGLIPVIINHHPVTTTHSCVALLGKFCGQHGHCPSDDPNHIQPSSSLVSMFNGYFSLPSAYSDVNDTAVRRISLACTESYHAFLLQCPETITIYKKTWFPNAESHERRRVRCNPATDTLYVRGAPGYSSEQRHPSPSLDNPEDAFQEELLKWFPQNTDTFANFRTIISTFRSVLCDFVGDPDMRKPLMFSRAFEDAQFKQFLIFFERLERLYLCPDSGRSVGVREWERVGHVDNRRDNADSQIFIGDSRGILNCDQKYNDYVQAQRELSSDSGECCWVPIPRGFERSWLFRSEGVCESGSKEEPWKYQMMRYRRAPGDPSTREIPRYDA